MHRKGIWEYGQLLEPFVETENRFTLGEGHTPLQENQDLAKNLGIESIRVKREDLNPTGSHKDRGLAFQISAHIQENKSNFALSSSGNAAISAIHLLKDTRHTLHIFLSTKLSVNKINRLVKPFDEEISNEIFKGKDTTHGNIHFHFGKKPLTELFQFCKNNNATSLRGSTDEYGYQGFKTIAYELPSDFDSIFIPSSSGTTAKGIYEGLKEKKQIKPFHIVQTSKINTLVHRFDKDYVPSIESQADAIVDRVGHRIVEIEKIIKISDGTGWIIDDTQISQAQKLLETADINSSNESALTIAAIQKAREKGYNIQNPICIFTGTT